MIDYYTAHPAQLIYDMLFKLVRIWWLPILAITVIAVILILDKKYNFTR